MGSNARRTRHAALSRDFSPHEPCLTATHTQVNEYAEDQSRCIDLCDTRTQHLMEAEQPARLEDWKRMRLERVVVDHLLRTGYHETARQLVQQQGFEELVDVALFEESHRIAADLQATPPTNPLPSLGPPPHRAANALGQAGKSQSALAWCQEHKSRLRKLESHFEVDLHIQRFVDLARAGKRLEAIRHARAQLVPVAQSNPKMAARVEAVLGVLALGPDTTSEKYRR